MIDLICDFCKERQSYPHYHQVILKGVGTKRGGILLVDTAFEWQFCKPECFWNWIEGQVK